MRILFLGFWFFCNLAIVAGVSAQPAQFFENLQDIPLMPGLVERGDDTLFFDKPEGRVVESVAGALLAVDSAAFWLGKCGPRSIYAWSRIA